MQGDDGPRMGASLTCNGVDDEPRFFSKGDGILLNTPGIPRLHSLSPPFSLQCQIAAGVVPLVAWGTLASRRLTPTPTPGAVEVWWLLAAVWIPLLARLLLTDPASDGDAWSPLDNVYVLRCVESGAVRCPYGCRRTTAARTKHCRKCGKCVVGFDHHCLWLNTCIGLRNYRTWVVFVSFLLAWFLVSCAISWHSLVRALYVDGRRLAVGHRPAALLTGLGTFMISLWLLLLLSLHGYLWYRGMTTYEWIQSGGPNDLKVLACRARRFATPDAVPLAYTTRVQASPSALGVQRRMRGRWSFPLTSASRRRSRSWAEMLTLSLVEVHDVYEPPLLSDAKMLELAAQGCSRKGRALMAEVDQRHKGEAFLAKIRIG